MNAKAAAAFSAILWGFTYLLAAEMLPPNPLLLGAVRALGGGLVLLACVRRAPPRGWRARLLLLGTLNCGLFFGLFFVSALRLAGGVAAIVQALGPLLVILCAWGVLRQRPGLRRLLALGVGAGGVALVVLKGTAVVDTAGVAAGLGSAACAALGSVLLNKWGRPAMPMPAFTGWLLCIGGAELALAAWLTGDVPAAVSAAHWAGFAILALLLTALPFVLWYHAMASEGAVAITPFVLLTPVTAFVLDAACRGLTPAPLQTLGAALVLVGLILCQWAPAPPRPAGRPAAPRAPAQNGVVTAK